MFNIEQSKKLILIHDEYYSNDWDSVIDFISKNNFLLNYLIKLNDLVVPNNLQLEIDEAEDYIKILFNPKSVSIELLETIGELSLYYLIHNNRFKLVPRDR